MYMTASRGEGRAGQGRVPHEALRGWGTSTGAEGHHAQPVPSHRGLGGPEVHDGAALHLQAEQRDGCEAFPPSGTCCHEWGLSPGLAALPQQGTAGGRGYSRMGEGMARWERGWQDGEVMATSWSFTSPMEAQRGWLQSGRMERDACTCFAGNAGGCIYRDAGRDVPWGGEGEVCA